ncbi:hypothetical protein OKJ48_41535 [Streptomyces kunmingensis]|uniref:Tryptophan-associated transmembrane protein (Trp_oprn_chp) n=1 Tax=Streptomyces kunmingensis TaxID=68225 RepID=A0ABU6CPM6_9ACTN|nr:hypothetical protein [Streptomyces kunmingensis]MEB3966668.1 hypothetical protein [Streptomyces kunmingensis]
MLRNIVGSVLALIGAAAVVWSPFRVWYDGRHGRDYRLAELFGSLFLPFVILALLALLGLVLRSRLLIALTGVVVLAGTVLWLVRVAQAEDELVLTADGHGVGDGVAAALGGGLLLVVSALVMSGRGHHRHRRPAPAPAHDPQAWENTGHEQPHTWDAPEQERAPTWDGAGYDQPRTWDGTRHDQPRTWDTPPQGQPRTWDTPEQEQEQTLTWGTTDAPGYGRSPDRPPTWGNVQPGTDRADGSDGSDETGPSGGSTRRGGPA